MHGDYRLGSLILEPRTLTPTLTPTLTLTRTDYYYYYHTSRISSIPSPILAEPLLTYSLTNLLT